jgi:hypothetical protein
MFNARDAYTALLEDPRLDELLVKARTSTKMGEAPREPFIEIAEQLESRSVKAAESLKEILTKKEAEKAEKIATVFHLIEMGTRLLEN